MSSPVNVGDVLAGKYQVERVLGVGGMGVVVAAKHLSLGERVAIKFLLPAAMARADVVQRFLREGQAAARLKSEHITRVHDVGKLETGEPFLVMEYLDGKDLGVVLREKGPLAPEAAVEHVMQACEALAEAHAAGIVHRDLKPSNLFVIKRLDGSPSIKLIDFGISKVQMPGAEGAEGEMTATAVMMGSPLYMAPEQMASARDVDARADIWSLGIILHTVLTGAPPFRASTVMGVYELITQGAPPIRTLRPDVPEGLEAAILKCLVKDRRLRFGSVGELAEAIAPFGPPDARSVADRIKRIIAARSGMASIPPPADAPVPVAALTPAHADTELSVPDSSVKRTRESAPEKGSQPTGSSAAIDPHPSEGPWDQRTRPPSSNRKKGALIAAAIVVVTAPTAFFALRANHGGKVAPAADPSVTAVIAAPKPSVTAAEPAPSVAPAEPVTLGGDPPNPPAQPAPTASATASATPSATPTASAKTARPAGPTPPAKTAKPRSAEDLFGTQK